MRRPVARDGCIAAVALAVKALTFASGLRRGSPPLQKKPPRLLLGLLPEGREVGSERRQRLRRWWLARSARFNSAIQQRQLQPPRRVAEGGHILPTSELRTDDPGPETVSTTA